MTRSERKRSTEQTNSAGLLRPEAHQCRPADAVEKYAGGTYIQHNPQVADGKQAFIDYFVRVAKDCPGSGSSSSGRLPTVTM
jgi:predicted SnoaL-like aldol condensation-catalyzing enzyme